jgi:hypothetical protein
MTTTRVVSIPDKSFGPANITTQNLVPAGVATPGSAVAISPDGRSGLTIQVTGTYTGALSLQGTIDGIHWVTVGGTPFVSLATGAALVAIGSGGQGIFQCDCAGFRDVRVTALAAVTGTAIITLRATNDPVTLAITRALPAVVLAASSAVIGSVNATQVPSATAGGYTSRSCVVSAASTNATLLKNSGGTVGRIVATNTSAAIKYIALFSKATAPVTGTDTPIFKFGIPPGQTLQITSDAGMRIATGIGFAITGGAPLLDNTPVAANDVILNIEFV